MPIPPTPIGLDDHCCSDIQVVDKPFGSCHFTDDECQQTPGSEYGEEFQSQCDPFVQGCAPVAYNESNCVEAAQGYGHHCQQEVFCLELQDKKCERDQCSSPMSQRQYCYWDDCGSTTAKYEKRCKDGTTEC